MIPVILPWPKKWREQLERLRDDNNDLRARLRALNDKVSNVSATAQLTAADCNALTMRIWGIADAVLAPGDVNIGGSPASLESRRRSHRDWREDMGLVKHGTVVPLTSCDKLWVPEAAVVVVLAQPGSTSAPRYHLGSVNDQKWGPLQ